MHVFHNASTYLLFNCDQRENDYLYVQNILNMEVKSLILCQEIQAKFHKKVYDYELC